MGRNEWLSRTECSALRGIAILGIILHNYCHWLTTAVKENEYTFSIDKSRGLWHALTHPDIYLPVHLLSYFGHYGVPIFLFLSGFGLVMKYEQASAGNHEAAGKPAFLSFTYQHYKKLFHMMIAGFVAFVIVDAITPGSFRFHAGHVIAQLLMVINLLAHPDHIIWPGPYWFFGLMMQLYIVYRLLICQRSNATAVALVAVCWAAQAVCDPCGETLNRLRYNCIGGMLPFCAGILLARTRPSDMLRRLSRPHALSVPGASAILRPSVARWCAFAAIMSVIALAFCFNYQTWLWIPLAVIAASVAAVKAMPRSVLSWLAQAGSISAAMFVTHPILRKIFIPISHNGYVYDGLVLYIITAIGVAWFFARRVFPRS